MHSSGEIEVQTEARDTRTEGYIARSIDFANFVKPSSSSNLDCNSVLGTSKPNNEVEISVVEAGIAVETDRADQLTNWSASTASQIPPPEGKIRGTLILTWSDFSISEFSATVSSDNSGNRGGNVTLIARDPDTISLNTTVSIQILFDEFDTSREAAMGLLF